jgi:hypothetical protein
MSFVTHPSDSGCKNLFPRACAAGVSVSIAELERPARGLGHRLSAHVATHKLPSSRAALYSKTVSSLSRFSHQEPDERILPRCAGIPLPSSSASPLTGSYPAGILSLFERLKAVGHKLVAENFGLRAKPFSKDAKKPRTGAGRYSSESKLASVKLANRSIGPD